jgi:moderate conductance mechanosensitive channel
MSIPGHFRITEVALEASPELVRLALAVLWAVAHLAIIVVVAYLAGRALGAFLTVALSRALRLKPETPREGRIKTETLISVATHAGQIIIGIIAAFMALRELGFDITPLLASAGIAGLALGLGAQTLIRDFLGGFLIIVEDQFSVGDVIKVGEHTGTVERIDLRRTVIRNAEGAVINIPNSEVRIVLNLTREWSRVVLDVEVAFDEDPARAQAILSRVVAEIGADPVLGPSIIEPPAEPGIEALSASSLRLRLMIKTRPTQQWAVGRELRRRVQAAFQREGIRLARPEQAVVLRDERAPQTPEGGHTKDEESGWKN